MMYKELRARKPNRLKEFSAGKMTYFFVTICVKEKFEIFGEVKDDEIRLSEVGLLLKRKFKL